MGLHSCSIGTGVSGSLLSFLGKGKGTGFKRHSRIQVHTLSNLPAWRRRENGVCPCLPALPPFWAKVRRRDRTGTWPGRSVLLLPKEILLSSTRSHAHTHTLTHTHTHSQVKTVSQDVPHALLHLFHSHTNLSCGSHTASHSITYALPPCHIPHLSATPSQMTPLSKQTHTHRPWQRNEQYHAVSHGAAHGLLNQLCSTHNLPERHSHTASQNVTRSLTGSPSLAHPHW